MKSTNIKDKRTSAKRAGFDHKYPWSYEDAAPKMRHFDHAYRTRATTMAKKKEIAEDDLISRTKKPVNGLGPAGPSEQ